MTFTEDWFGQPSCLAVSRLVKKTRNLAGMIVEVGCWEGRSTSYLANAAFPDLVYAVDTWAGSPGEISAELAAERDVYQTFLRNMEALTSGNVVDKRMDWRRFFELHPGPVRFCHIDATHTYAEVKANLELVAARLPPGGIVCGDDAHHPPVINAVTDTVGETVREATLWIWERPHG